MQVFKFSETNFWETQVPINEENKFLLTLNRYIYHVLFTYIIIRYSPFTYSTSDINNEKYIQSVKISQHENILGLVEKKPRLVRIHIYSIFRLTYMYKFLKLKNKLKKRKKRKATGNQQVDKMDPDNSPLYMFSDPIIEKSVTWDKNQALDYQFLL